MRRTPRPSVKWQLATREKQKQALELGVQGLNYTEIAKAMGYKNKSTAHKLIHAALDAVPAEARETYRRIEDQRLEALFSVYHPLAMSGDLDAAKFVETLIGRRARLMGINAPEQAPVNKDGETVGDGHGFDAVAILASRIARIAGRSGASGGAGGADS